MPSVSVNDTEHRSNGTAGRTDVASQVEGELYGVFDEDLKERADRPKLQAKRTTIGIQILCLKRIFASERERMYVENQRGSSTKLFQ